MKTAKQKLTLDQAATYQIRVPGVLDSHWIDSAAGMRISIESPAEGDPITILEGDIDQAALHSLLQRIYSLGLPLISVVCVECTSEAIQ